MGMIDPLWRAVRRRRERGRPSGPCRVSAARARRRGDLIVVTALVLALGLVARPEAAAGAEGRKRAVDVGVPCTAGVGDSAALVQAVADADADPDFVHNLILGANCTYVLAGELVIPVDLNIVITGSNSVITMDPSVDDGLLVISPGAFIRFYGVTFRGGDTATLGGAVVTLLATVWLVNCTLTGNTAQQGGGAVASIGSTLNVYDSFIGSNSSEAGGGIASFSGGSLYLSNTQVVSNSASEDGGGIYVDTGIATLRNSLISANIAGNDGGGTYNGISGAINSYGSLWSGNSAVGRGGGIASTDAFYGISTGITGNTAAFGGGYDNQPGDQDSVVRLSGGYVRSNVATTAGGGILNAGNSVTQAVVSATTVSGNRPTGCVNVTGCS